MVSLGRFKNVLGNAIYVGALYDRITWALALNGH